MIVADSSIQLLNFQPMGLDNEGVSFMPTSRWGPVAKENDGALTHQFTAREDNKGLRDV